LDSSYGNIGVNLVNFYYTNVTDSTGKLKRIKEKIPVEIDLCANAGFNFTN